MPRKTNKATETTTASSAKTAAEETTTATVAQATAVAEAPKKGKGKGKAAGATDKGKGAEAPKQKAGGAEKPELSGSKVRVLEALAAAEPEGLTRTELAEQTGINKGWAKLLGAPTKGETNGMEGAGLVKSHKHEGERSLRYTITAAGKKALAKAQG
jgi:DNA-binding MarR family transcriptional regulator